MTRRGASAGDLERARAVCETCEVKGHCLEEALETNAIGVWGGMTRKERNDLGFERTRKDKAFNKHLQEVRIVECGEWAGPVLRASVIRAEMQDRSDWGSAGEGGGRVREAARRPVGGTGQIMADGNWSHHVPRYFGVIPRKPQAT